MLLSAGNLVLIMLKYRVPPGFTPPPLLAAQGIIDQTHMVALDIEKNRHRLRC